MDLVEIQMQQWAEGRGVPRVSFVPNKVMFHLNDFNSEIGAHCPYPLALSIAGQVARFAVSAETLFHFGFEREGTIFLRPALEFYVAMLEVFHSTTDGSIDFRIDQFVSYSAYAHKDLYNGFVRPRIELLTVEEKLHAMQEMGIDAIETRRRRFIAGLDRIRREYAPGRVGTGLKKPPAWNDQSLIKRIEWVANKEGSVLSPVTDVSLLNTLGKYIPYLNSIPHGSAFTLQGGGELDSAPVRKADEGSVEVIGKIGWLCWRAVGILSGLDDNCQDFLYKKFLREIRAS